MCFQDVQSAGSCRELEVIGCCANSSFVRCKFHELLGIAKRKSGLLQFNGNLFRILLKLGWNSIKGVGPQAGRVWVTMTSYSPKCIPQVVSVGRTQEEGLQCMTSKASE